MAEQTHPSESRLLGALAHAAIIVQGVGIIAGILVYINQRDKSRFAAFQALQAAVYQMFAMIVIVGGWIIWTACYTLSFIPIIQLAETNPDAPPPAFFWISMGSMIIPIGLMMVLGLYGLIGAIRVWQGHNFRYAVIGGWLERSDILKDESPAAA